MCRRISLAKGRTKIQRKNRFFRNFFHLSWETGAIFLEVKRSNKMFGADQDRIGLIGKPPAAEHSFPSKSQ
jgi:hypothetical protein